MTPRVLARGERASISRLERIHFPSIDGLENVTRYSVVAMQLRRASLSLALASLFAAIACEPAIDDSTPCGRAKKLLGECGVLMPITSTDTCTGTAETLSNCLLTAGGSCDALAVVSAHLDRCAANDGGAGLPADFPGVSATDAGVTAAPQGDADASVLPANDAGVSGTVDAGHDGGVAQVDAGADAGLTLLFDQSGTVGSGEDQQFQTARLSAGTYDFVANVSGAASIYVRKGFVPSTATYDCVLAAPGDRCPMPVATTAILYVLVHGQKPNTQFRVTASQE